MHSNGLCVLGVDAGHPLLAPPRVVTRVAYRAHDSKNLLAAEARGKKKAGAVFVLPRDMLCEVTLDDGSAFTVYACVRGSVIEINRNLIARPEMLADASGAGYVAVLLPKVEEKGSIGQAMLAFDARTPLEQPSGNAKRRLEGRPVRTKSGRTGQRHARERPPCWTFQSTGACKFGANCRFAHGDAGGGGGGGGGGGSGEGGGAGGEAGRVDLEGAGGGGGEDVEERLPDDAVL